MAGCEKAGGQNAAKAMKMPPVPVIVGHATKKDVPIRIDVVGTAQPLSIVTLKPQVAGFILKKAWHFGDPIHKGQLLYVIDPRPFQVALDQAKARLLQDQAKLAQDQALEANAKLEAKKKQLMFKRQAATEFEAQQSQNSADAATATVQADHALVEADKAAIDQAKLDLGYTEVRSPIDGYSGPTITDAGNVVKANETELIKLFQIKPIYIECAVPQRYMDNIRGAMASHGVNLDVTVPDDPAVHESAKLQFVNTVDTDTGTIKLRGVTANDHQRLWPGQYINVSVVLGEHKGAVLVPSQALQTSQKGSFVWVVKGDGSVAIQLVELGDVIGEQTIVTHGLSGDETVVTEGQIRLTPTAHVQVVTREDAPGPPGTPGTSPAAAGKGAAR